MARMKVGKASGALNKCLIDTLQQVLHLKIDVQTVRTALMTEFPGGQAKVTKANFLTFHLCALAILHHFGLDPQQYTLVCFDLNFEDNGDVVGHGPIRLYMARSNGNHFVPLHPRLHVSSQKPSCKGSAT